MLRRSLRYCSLVQGPLDKAFVFHYLMRGENFTFVKITAVSRQENGLFIKFSLVDAFITLHSTF